MIDQSNASDQKSRQFAVQNANWIRIRKVVAVENIDLERSTLGIAVPVLIQLVMQFAPNVGLLGEARLAMNDVETAVEFEETLEVVDDEETEPEHAEKLALVAEEVPAVVV